MSAQTAAHSPEFQAIIVQVETALAQAAIDARELAERTNTPLVTLGELNRQPKRNPNQKKKSSFAKNIPSLTETGKM